jgi:transcriptional regulator with XRE-family HTH domain
MLKHEGECMGTKNQNQKPKIIQPFQEVGSRLRELREYLKKTQAEMSADLGVSLPMFQNYEAGKHLISAVGIKALVGMGYSANWILCDKGEMKITDTTETDLIDNKTALKIVVKTLWTEIEESDAFLSASSAAGIVALAYDEYLASNQDEWKLRDKIKALVQIADQGEQ